MSDFLGSFYIPAGSITITPNEVNMMGSSNWVLQSDHTAAPTGVVENPLEVIEKIVKKQQYLEQEAQHLLALAGDLEHAKIVVKEGGKDFLKVVKLLADHGCLT